VSRFDLSGRVAVVTGGAGTGHGIGRSIALSFADAGADVAIVGRHEETLRKVADEISERGRKALVIVADVADADDSDRIINEAVAGLGRVDILVNGVGGISYGKPEEISAQDWDDSIALNLNSTFYCCAAAARHMIAAGGGRIVNIASSSGIKGEEFMAPYAASKAAIINLTRSLAISWSEHNITVNCIAPGSVALPDHVPEGMTAEEYEKQQRLGGAEGTALQLPATPDDIANAAVFFASAASELMTGETLPVRGAEWASAYS
jgi:2-dehydro-3-deoxy-D-gluconate 5-dehydrogenase